MTSERRDGRGHWPAGKRRSRLPARERRALIRRVRLALDHGESRRAIARKLRISDRTLGRWLKGEDFPMKAKRHAL